MTNIYENNPLHGKSLEAILNELVDHYGWEIMGAYININCFKTKPSIASSCKFLNKTQWAKEAVEAFYMYKFKNLPKPSDDQYDLPPRDRIVPPEDKPRAPKELSLEDAERIKYNKQKKNRERAMRQKASTPSNPWGRTNS
ncbi:VF530 family DNA-binding protein [Psychrosphaera ytuae]|uniref:VF530 family DNA-binding protein n=1 Tax=Psychrosphaera ytuae TaxID=2820710 RepID=A0A975HKP9_9GAMM|nr:VF530 family DNA-binding protein [Psychrosphaera ytuae]QTH64529.1 VF530 family DNA-binding protein [Psychrosphaera ytuae]